MTDERPDSLAAQAASWVPPWERAPRPPDPAYAAAHRPEADAKELDAQLDAPEVDVAGSDVPEAEAAGSDVPEAEAAGSDVPEAEDSELEGEVASGVTGGEAASELLIDGEVAAEPVDAEVPAEAASEPVDGGDESGADGEAVALSAPSSGIPAQGRRGRDGGAASGESSPRTEEVELKPAEEPALKALDDGELRAALEAILLVVDEPVAEMQLAQIVEQATERVAAMLEDISARYTAAGHGFDLRRAAGGWRLYTRPEYAPYVERFVLDGQSVRLTQAALETLAVVAYKQPVTRSRISAIRGVNCDGVMRTLVTRGLIEECGTEGETGAFLYRTTALFLEKLGLNSVDQLPPLAPFLPDDVEEVLDASG